MGIIVNNFRSVYGELDSKNLDLLETIYADNITFIDPFHEIHGLNKLMNYFSTLYKNIESCHFNFQEVYERERSAMITWIMKLEYSSLSKTEIEVPGSTEIRFDDKIFFHQDYFDAGKLIYENIPLVGTVIRYVKKQV